MMPTVKHDQKYERELQVNCEMFSGYKFNANAKHKAQDKLG